MLVVEDEPDLQDLLVRRLRDAGHEVAAVASGPGALAAVELDGPPDAAVLDVDLPGMDGLELLDQLRQHKPELPTLFITVLWSGELLNELKASGVPYLSKPFSAAELQTAVDGMLGG
jgi:CheY-like chemotaxis protein